MKFPTITDSRGNKSQTLFWVSMALIALFSRFIAGIFTNLGQIGAVEFATAFTTVIAPWIAREAVDKIANKPSTDISLPPGA